VVHRRTYRGCGQGIAATGDASGRFEFLKAPNLFAEEVRHFTQCVEDGTLPCVTAGDNARAQATVERILEMANAPAASPVVHL
jgi:predicted dehydrogenase